MKAILFNSRHSHPTVDGLEAVFSAEVNPLDFLELDRQAIAFFETHSDKSYDIYVTGLTPATVAVIKAAVATLADLTLWHYDRNSDNYVPQRVVTSTKMEQDMYSYGIDVPVIWHNDL